MKQDPMPVPIPKVKTAGIGPVDASEDHHLRSQFMRRLIQNEIAFVPQNAGPVLPHTLVQFWNDANAVPSDVRECIDSWRAIETIGFERLVFDDDSAARFIAEHYGRRYHDAFARCRHPAMRSDYFRLCFIKLRGGLYVDADDAYQGGDLEPWFQDGRLKLQPLCYESPTDSMVSAADSTADPRDFPELIFYVNNNPIIAPPRHPVIHLALERSTRILLSQAAGEAQDVQSTTGPGNLTASLAQHAAETERTGEPQDFAFLGEWEAVAVSRWPLDYRRDKRNWRLWDGRDV